MTRLCKRCGKETERYKSGVCKLCARRAVASWNSRNPERVKAISAAWYRSNLTKAKKKNNSWTERNPERMAALRKTWYTNVKAEVYEHYGSVCTCCGETEPGFLVIDHVNEDGGLMRRKVHHRGGGFYRWIIKNKFPEYLQILCYNCNRGRAQNQGVCPHQKFNVFKSLLASETD